MRFTDLFIKNMKPGERKYYRREAGGFTVRVMPSGVKTWLFIYTFDGKRKEMNLGLYCDGDGKPGVSLADAREKFNDATKLLKNGIDPGALERQQQEEHRLAPTVADLCDEYIKHWAKPRKKSWENDKRSLNKDVIPTWGKIKTKDIRKRDIVLLLEDVVKKEARRSRRTASGRSCTKCSLSPWTGTSSRPIHAQASNPSPPRSRRSGYFPKRRSRHFGEIWTALT